MDSVKDALTSFVLDPKHHDALAVVKGLRNGLVYGWKIRFPHALVMTFLFRQSNPLGENVRFILDASRTHSFNLGKFVFLYKGLMLLQKYADRKELSHHAFVAGLVGGYFVFGEYSAINYQIVLYLFSRILIGLASLGAERAQVKAPPQTYPVFAALVWAVVMWLFRHERHTLQPSLAASMQYLYNDSEKWDSLRNWIWHNK